MLFLVRKSRGGYWDTKLISKVKLAPLDPVKQNLSTPGHHFNWYEHTSVAALLWRRSLSSELWCTIARTGAVVGCVE